MTHVSCRTIGPLGPWLKDGRQHGEDPGVAYGIDDKRIGGAVTLVARRGHVVWFKSQGMADLEAGKPMRSDTMFRICSMTKPVTSLAVMMLYEEGHFLLDDPISAYLPEF